MTIIAIINRKGGSGKSTLATHVATWLARSGERVMLGDVDRQQSTVSWLKRRAAQVTVGEPLVGWAVDPRNVLRPPVGTRHVVLDTPGGLAGFDMSRVLAYAELVLMPVCDSIFDRESAADCLAEMRAHPRVAGGRVTIGVVGMRVDGRTRGEQALREWAGAQAVPFVGVLREARAYVRAVEQGLTIFDLPPSKVQPDLAQWQPLLAWLQEALRSLADAAAQRTSRPVLEAGSSRPMGLVPPGGPQGATRGSRPMPPGSAEASVVPPSAVRQPPQRPRPGAARSAIQRLMAWLLPQRAAAAKVL